jgi:O-antigen/teichoic acid export membrane protein
MRLFRRNALGLYAVYGAAVVSGLVVTPITLHAIGSGEFGVWKFIGGITIYVSLLDLGVGPSIVRFAAEARGRGSTEDVNVLASVGLAIYAVIGLATLPLGAAIAWFVPELVHMPAHLEWPARICAFLVVMSLAARFPLGLFYNLLGGQQRFDVQNLGNLVSTILYAALVAAILPRGGGLIFLGVVTLVTTVIRLGIPLAWLRAELPYLSLKRRYLSRSRARELLQFSFSNFLIAMAQKIVFTTDVVVVGIVLGSHQTTLYAVPATLFAIAFGIGIAAQTLLFPAFAEYEGSGELESQRRLLLTGVRAGTAGVTMLAMPFLFIPDKIIHAWIGGGYGPSTAVMILLGVVILIHAPIALFIQYLIARARQKAIAITLLLTTGLNVVLSVILAATVGIWGVALATVITDLAALAIIAPYLVAPIAGLKPTELARALGRPLITGVIVAVPVLGLVGRSFPDHHVWELAPAGALWVIACSAALWRFGIAPSDRAAVRREFLNRKPRAAEVLD